MENIRRTYGPVNESHHHDHGNGNQTIKPKIFKQLLAAAIACLSSIGCGLVLGYSSPALPKFQERGLLNDEEASWFGSFGALGAIFGAPIAGFMVDRWGRKPSLMITSVPYLIGWVCIICARNVVLLYVGRILTGIGMGMTTVTVALYLAEIASKDIRGFIGTLLQLCTVIGILLAFITGSYLDATWLAVCCMLAPSLLIVLMLSMPETPRWYLQYSTKEEAVQALVWLRGDGPHIEEELNETHLNLESQALIESSKLTLNNFTKPGLYKPLLITLGLMLIQQYSGINAVIFYSETIFESAGFKGKGALPSIIIAIVQVIFTLVAAIFMDRAGRKTLLLGSVILMMISCITFGVYYYLADVKHYTGLSWLSICSLSLYIIGFSLGLGPIPWIIMAEILPTKGRGPASSMAVILNWTSCFIVTKVFYYMLNWIRSYGTFWLFGGILFAGIIFILIFMVETKGRSLEDIELYFEGNSSVGQYERI